MNIPLGQREGHRLEFKRADVLEDPVNVAREVAALLNAEGGDVWIGITEEEGVAIRAEPIAQVEVEQRKLHDSLLSRIEPAPTHDEVHVEPLDGLLVVHVKKGGRGPYAFLERSMRGFVIRVDGRNRPLSLDELRRRFQGPSRKAPVDDVARGLEKRRGKARLSDGSSEGLFLWFSPAEETRLELRNPQLERLLAEPELTHNRRIGWNFSSEFHRLVPKAGRARWAAAHPSHSLEVTQTGQLEFAVPLDRLYWKGAPREIYPWALVEYVLSIFRLYPELLRNCSSPVPGEVLVALSLRGGAGWTLRPHSPRSIGYELNEPQSAETDIELSPLRYDWAELASFPDRCGWRLVESVYDQFGFGPDQLPQEYNRATDRFELRS